jgi:hypothetical protein
VLLRITMAEDGGRWAPLHNYRKTGLNLRGYGRADRVETSTYLTSDGNRRRLYAPNTQELGHNTARTANRKIAGTQWAESRRRSGVRGARARPHA